MGYGAGVGALAGAYGGYQQAQQYNDWQQQNSQPTELYGTSGTNQGPMEDYNRYIVEEAMRMYQDPSTWQGGGGAGRNTREIADYMSNYAMGGNPLGQAVGDFSQQAMGGATNDWQNQAWQNVSGGPINEYIQQAMAAGFGQPGGQGGAGGAGGGGYNASWGGGGGAGAGPGRFENLAYERANADYESNPYLQKMIDAAARGTTREYQRGIEGINSNAANAGRYGSGAFQLAQGLAASDYGKTLGDMNTQAHYQDYNDFNQRQMQYAGMGGGWENSRQNANTAAATARAGQASAAGTARYGMDLGHQQQMSNMALQAILGQNQNMLYGGQALAENQMMGAQLGQSQQQLDMAGLQQAFGMNQGVDRARNAGRVDPWDNLGNLARMINAGGSPFYEQYRNQQQPGAAYGQVPMDVWANTLGGAATGYAAGSGGG
jgi:hypothetical protein